eukprot:10003415-Prorocentrum_lima.AAC.1
MTSSLVGSEMCIRDRNLFAMLDCQPAMFTTEMCSGLPAMCSLKGAVSYTHLTLPTICSV